LCTHP
jgi:hypothetical protein